MSAKSVHSSFFIIGIYAVLLGIIYYSTFSWLVTHDWSRGDYNYCYLVPFIVLYLLWDKRKSLGAMPSRPSWRGLLPLLGGTLLFWLGELSGEFFTLYVSFWLVVIGLTWLHLGWKRIRTIWFPLAMMLTMFPLPNFINTRITLKLKLLSSQLGVWLMQMWGMSAYREGNIIDLGFTQLQVVDACSGLRYLFPLIVLGILLAYFYKARFWKKVIIVLSTIPLSIITNSLRIALTGLLYEIWGAKVAEGFFHGFSGWFIFMFSFGILLLQMKLLNWRVFRVSSGEVTSKEQGERIKDQASRSEEEAVRSKERGGRSEELKEKGERSKEQDKQEIKNSKFRIQNSPFSPQFIVAVVLLGFTLLISRTVEFREKIPMNKSFAEFPLKIGKWTGTRLTMEQKFIDTLDLSDYIMVDYRDPHGKSVDLYVAYYQTQSKGKSIHSPTTCLPGSGWIFNQAGVSTIPTPGYDGGALPVRRVFMEKSGLMEVAYYWFPARGRILTNAYQLKIYNFWDALTKHRTDGALVRVITPVYNGESPTQAEKRLREFVRDVVPILDGFLPK